MVYAIPHAKGEAMSLPPLPEKECLGENDWQEIHGHTAEQMREYGALCRKAALEEVIEHFQRKHELCKTRHNYWLCAAIEMGELK